MVRQEIDRARRAYVRNYTQLWEWLQQRDAQCAWQLPLGDRNNPDYVEGWLVRGVLIVVIVRAEGMGWDLMVPHHDTRIEATLAAADAALQAHAGRRKV